MNLKNKRELTFLVSGILMLIIVIISVGFSIKFLVRNVNQALSQGVTQVIGAPRFNIEKAEAVLGE